MARRILVVEDHHDLRQMFVDALTLAGFHIFEAADGLQALRQLDGNPPDLVVLDLRCRTSAGWRSAKTSPRIS